MHPVQKITGGVCAPLGFQAAGVHCGVKPGSAKEDLALIYSEKAGHSGLRLYAQ